MELLDFRMHNGSRHFAIWRATCSWRRLRRHLEALPGLTITEFLTDGVMEGWLDFTVDGQRFSVNDPVGQYWFFAEDPAAPVPLLQRIVDHCEPLFDEPTETRTT